MGSPLVAVVPFVTFTRGEEERAVADVVAEDASIRLSRRSWIQVVDYLAARPLVTRKDRPHEIAARLHADYFLTGTVRQGRGGGYRITVKFAHTDDAVMVWARAFDVQATGEAKDSLDTVVSQIVYDLS